MKPIFQPSACLSPKEIKSYVQNKSTSTGTRRVEEHMLDCPLCADAVEGFGESGAETELAFSFDFAAVAPKEAKTVQMQPRRAVVWRRLAVAATVLVLISAGFFFFNSPSNDALYSDLYEPYSSNLLISMRGDSDHEIDADFEKAMIAYEAGKFSDSLPYFKNLLANNSDDAAINFYAGMAYLETGNIDKAIPVLEKVHEQKTSKYNHAATWYLALAQVKNGNRVVAKELTGALIKEGKNAYLEKATQLQAKL